MDSGFTLTELLVVILVVAVLAANGTDRTPVSKIIYLADECPTELKNPVHVSYRNFLFLDFHVESLPASPNFTGGTQSP